MQSHSYRGIVDLSDQELANVINEAFLEPLEDTAWTIILLGNVGSIVDLIVLKNTYDNRSIDRYNVELRFKEYYSSAGENQPSSPLFFPS